MWRLSLFILVFYGGSSFAAERFSGSATLSPRLATSANGQFSVDAQLAPALPAINPSARFNGTAKLLPDAQSVATACGPVGDSIFKNGFE